MRKGYIFFLALLLISLISSNQISGETRDDYIEILNNNLNVREGPGTNYNIIGQVNKNEQFPFIEEMDEWIKIDYFGQEGWVSREYVDKIKMDDLEEVSTVSKEEVTIPQDKVHIRKSPTTQSEIIYFANQGEKLVILEDLDHWLKVKLATEEVGYLYKSFTRAKSLANGNLFKGKTIVIDPGHGGYDVGAISVSGEYEKDYSLTTSLLLKEALENLGVEVLMTRESDDFVRLASRVSLSNLKNPDVFISIHYNSFPEVPSAKGISTFYYDEQDRALAQSVQKHLLRTSKANDRDTLYENLQVLRHNQSKSILIELGFISNVEEENLLKTSSYQKLLVEGIVRGLYEYFLLEK